MITVSVKDFSTIFRFISTNSNLPHSQTYNNEFGDKPIYFINLAGKCQRLFIGCKYKIKARLEFTKRYNWYRIEKFLWRDVTIS